MKPTYDEDGLRIYHADVLKGLRALPDASVHCVVTSPPYYGLRDYGVKGAFGLEATPTAYLRRMVRVFREIRRVLRDDGMLWLNLGDTYNAKAGIRTQSQAGKHGYWENAAINRRINTDIVKAKDLMGMPWRLALKLQADGWYLRRDIIWAKPNCMPESATDRPTTAHEYIFLLSPSAHYFYDGFAIRERPESGPSDLRKMAEGLDRIGGNTLEAEDPRYKANRNTNIGRKGAVGNPFGRNARSVWTIATTPSALKHYAMFPEELARKCILAGTSEHGVCADCGAPWKRLTAPTPEYAAKLGKGFTDHRDDLGAGMSQPKAEWFRPVSSEYITAGWAKTCKCKTRSRVPAVVLDPFCGMATTLKVARDLGRQGVGIEISSEYVTRSIERLRYGMRGAVKIQGAKEKDGREYKQDTLL